MKWRNGLGVAVVIAVLWALPGCRGKGDTEELKAIGSDTMLNLAGAWSERYSQGHPDVDVDVSGGGSGTGISALTDGKCQMANASREMTRKEIAAIQEKHGVEPVQHIVGYDALAIYVHKDNPIDEISLEELAEVFGEGGTIDDWSKLGDGSSTVGSIELVSRQNNSGTYACFKEVVLGKTREYKLNARALNGSKDVVALVGKTPGAIGYSGMGYATDAVKMLKIAPKKGEPAIAPTVENAKAKTYPLTRPLLIYTLGEPAGTLKKYFDWIMSEEGQAVVVDLGYVPAK